LKLPLPNHKTFLRKKGEREQGGEDYRRANENRIDTRSHVKQGHYLRDLVNHVRQARDQTGYDRANVDLWAAAELKQDKGNDRETSHGISVEILGPRIVEAIQIELKQRWERPNADGGEEGNVSTRKVAGTFVHGEDSGMAARFRSLICWLVRMNSSRFKARYDNMKTRTTLTLSVLLGAMIFAAPGVYAKRRGGGGGDAEEHRRKGVEYADAKQFDKAIEEFSKEVEAAPDNPEAYRDRGTAYRAAGRAAAAANDGPASAARFNSSVADFSKMIELSPKSGAGYVERAQTELAQIQYDAAINDLNKALELKGDEGLVYKFRGFAYIGLSQWDKAVVDFTAAIQKDPNDPQNYDRRAWANRNLKNFPAAIEDYTLILQKNPNDEDALVKRGATYAATTDYEKAIPDYQAALKLKPDDFATVQRMQYAQSQLAAKNAPPATPTPTPGAPVFTPARIFFGVLILLVIAAVVRFMTRGKPEQTSSTRIR
jgi:tetratricopeptide (TPR) repeat protein